MIKKRKSPILFYQIIDEVDLQSCRDYAFSNNYAERLISIINIKNHNSIKVAINNGMERNRTIDFHGNLVDVYQITIEKWNKLKQ